MYLCPDLFFSSELLQVLKSNDSVRTVYKGEYVCMSVCTFTGVLLECLMESYYILVSSASALWVWSTAAPAPPTPAESDPKGRPYSPIYPSLHLLDLCLQPRVYHFILLPLDSL